MTSRFQKILIIDDDSVDRLTLKKAIQRTGISNEILEAETGIEALIMIADISEKKEQLPDLIFLDINMPLSYSVFLLNKFGDQERTLDFYAEKYSKAFPRLLGYFLSAPYAYSTPEKLLNRCYEIRTFERFLEWFGLVKIRKISTFRNSDGDIINRSGLIKRLFIFD